MGLRAAMAGMSELVLGPQGPVCGQMASRPGPLQVRSGCWTPWAGVLPCSLFFAGLWHPGGLAPHSCHGLEATLLHPLLHNGPVHMVSPQSLSWQAWDVCLDICVFMWSEQS